MIISLWGAFVRGLMSRGILSGGAFVLFPFCPHKKQQKKQSNYFFLKEFPRQPYKPDINFSHQIIKTVLLIIDTIFGHAKEKKT